MSFSRTDLENTINDLINNYKKRILMNKKGKKYLDGNGLKRITDIFKKVIKDKK